MNTRTGEERLESRSRAETIVLQLEAGWETEMSKQWEWQDYYLEAFLETNPENLLERVAAAEKAIFSRTKELGKSSDTEPEWQAIADAMTGLTILKKEIKSQAGIEMEGKSAFGQAASGISAGRSPSNAMDVSHYSRATKN